MRWLRSLRQFAIAAIGIVLLSQLVRPSNTRQILEAQNAAFAGMIRTAIAVRHRDPSAVDMVLAMGAEEQKELYASLLPEDLVWLTDMLKGA